MVRQLQKIRMQWSGKVNLIAVFQHFQENILYHIARDFFILHILDAIGSQYGIKFRIHGLQYRHVVVNHGTKICYKSNKK